jgi:alkylhydroperoxidase family enzyme
MRADSRAGDEAEGAVPGEDKKQAAHRALVDRVLNGTGRASAEQRARAFSQQVEDALAVCAAFNTTDRLADAFGFELLSPEGFEAEAKYLLKRGYR